MIFISVDDSQILDPLKSHSHLIYVLYTFCLLSVKVWTTPTSRLNKDVNFPNKTLEIFFNGERRFSILGWFWWMWRNFCRWQHKLKQVYGRHSDYHQIETYHAYHMICVRYVLCFVLGIFSCLWWQTVSALSQLLYHYYFYFWLCRDTGARLLSVLHP